LGKKKKTKPRQRPGPVSPKGLVKLDYNWGLVIFILLVAIALRVHLLSVPLERDEGEYAYAGQLTLQGFLPYAKVYTMKMPGIYGAYALMMNFRANPYRNPPGTDAGKSGHHHFY
jgi:hypothetical protein